MAQRYLRTVLIPLRLAEPTFPPKSEIKSTQTYFTLFSFHFSRSTTHTFMMHAFSRSPSFLIPLIFVVILVAFFLVHAHVNCRIHMWAVAMALRISIPSNPFPAHKEEVLLQGRSGQDVLHEVCAIETCTGQPTARLRLASSSPV